MYNVDPSSTRLRHSAQCQSLYSSFPGGHLHTEALNAATPLLLLGETSAHISTATDTHMDPPGSWAQKLPLLQQEYPSHPCLMHTCTNGLTINPQTGQALWKLAEVS